MRIIEKIQIQYTCLRSRKADGACPAKSRTLNSRHCMIFLKVKKHEMYKHDVYVPDA